LQARPLSQAADGLRISLWDEGVRVQHRTSVIGALWLCFTLGAVRVRAQGRTTSRAVWASDASVAVGLSHVFRFDDQTFGNRPVLSGGFALEHRSGLAFDVDASRAFGLSARPAPCAVYADGVPLPCVGGGRDGVLSVQTFTVGARYRFRRGRINPYVTAGLGVLRSWSVWSTARVDGSRVVLTEEERRDTGIGPDVGAGLNMRIGRHLSVRPEVRWLEASARSALNLSATRVVVRTAYAW
jgi:hypothetical protein